MGPPVALVHGKEHWCLADLQLDVDECMAHLRAHLSKDVLPLAPTFEHFRSHLASALYQHLKPSLTPKRRTEIGVDRPCHNRSRSMIEDFLYVCLSSQPRHRKEVLGQFERRFPWCVSISLLHWPLDVVSTSCMFQNFSMMPSMAGLRRLEMSLYLCKKAVHGLDITTDRPCIGDYGESHRHIDSIVTIDEPPV